tara:strand:+ start:1951 stop:3018 length:1068 start_codon:yes stop_codon:yes gene_type:complete
MITADYCPDWTRLDVAREYLTNALDSPQNWEVTFDDKGAMYIRSLNTKLHPSVLALGVSSNRDDSSAVGTHGEGLVVSMAVALREGLDLIFYNDDRDWTPKFEHHPQFDKEVLVIYATPTETYNEESFIVKISGYTEDELEEITKRCLYLQKDETLGKVGTCHMGRVLFDKKGDLYVGGVWVTKTNLDYTYDFNPEFLHLNRDRKTVEHWDLKTSVAKIQQLVSAPEFVAKLVEEKSIDVDYLQYTPVTKAIKDECFKLYQNKYDGKMLASSQTEVSTKEAEGYSNLIVENDTFSGVVQSSEGYKAIEFERDQSTPVSSVEELLIKMSTISKAKSIEAVGELLDTFKRRGVKWGK